MDYGVAVGSELMVARRGAGNLRRARAGVRGATIDYLAPESLEVPSVFWVTSKRLRSLGSQPPSPIDLALNVAGFVPFGVLLVVTGRARQSLLRVGFACALMSLAIETGQILFETRIPSVYDLVANTAGGLLGAIAARSLRMSR